MSELTVSNEVLDRLNRFTYSDRSVFRQGLEDIASRNNQLYELVLPLDPSDLIKSLRKLHSDPVSTNNKVLHHAVVLYGLVLNREDYNQIEAVTMLPKWDGDLSSLSNNPLIIPQEFISNKRTNYTGTKRGNVPSYHKLIEVPPRRGDTSGRDTGCDNNRYGRFLKAFSS